MAEVVAVPPRAGTHRRGARVRRRAARRRAHRAHARPVRRRAPGDDRRRRRATPRRSATRCSTSAPTGPWPTCPTGLVYAGFSFGVGTAQRLAQTRPGARGALLYEACIPITGEWAFGPWPDGVPVQIHGMDEDPFFALEGDLDAARELVETVGPELAELFVYPGDQHLFTDSSLPSYDADATALVVQRSREFLDRVS